MNALFQELFHAGIYKRNQGRITRQVTFAAVALAVGIGCWQLSQTMLENRIDSSLGIPLVSGAVPSVLAMVFWWTAYRLVNVPRCADFLIAVEAEMNKVSWPSRSELFRSSLVVLVTIFALAAVLFAFDAFWTFALRWVI